MLPHHLILDLVVAQVAEYQAVAVHMVAARDQEIPLLRPRVKATPVDLVLQFLVRQMVVQRQVVAEQEVRAYQVLALKAATVASG